MGETKMLESTSVANRSSTLVFPKDKVRRLACTRVCFRLHPGPGSRDGREIFAPFTLGTIARGGCKAFDFGARLGQIRSAAVQ